MLDPPPSPLWPVVLQSLQLLVAPQLRAAPTAFPVVPWVLPPRRLAHLPVARVALLLLYLP